MEILDGAVTPKKLKTTGLNDSTVKFLINTGAAVDIIDNPTSES